jgi:hypothetical protein
MTDPVVKPPGKIAYLLRVETTNDESLIRRLRLALKVLGRQFGLRCTSLEEERTR